MWCNNRDKDGENIKNKKLMYDLIERTNLFNTKLISPSFKFMNCVQTGSDALNGRIFSYHPFELLFQFFDNDVAGF